MSSPAAATKNGRPLRVAITARSVYPLHKYGGLERHVYDLVRSLVGRGAHVTLITAPRDKRRPSDPEADALFIHPSVNVLQIPYVTFPLANRPGTTILDRSTAYPLFGRRAGRAAAALSAANAVDIVHGLGASVLGYAQPTAARRAPLVFNPQGMEEFGATDPRRAPLKRIGYLPLRAAVRRCAHAADRVIATDRSLVGPVLSHLRVARQKVRIVPNAIELTECDRPDSPGGAVALRRAAGLSLDDTLLLSVGRLERNKGFGTLIGALSTMKAAGLLINPWKWVLVGDGPMRSELRREITASGIAEHVLMTGRVDAAQLHAWYEAATVFVHPTLYEGSSLVTLEAMAHRRPIVATIAGGLPDKIIDGVNGWLVPPGDAAALASAIREALADSARLGHMGDESRAIVEREFSWTAATDTLLAVYRELLE
jgi:glycogen synthase